MAVVEKFCSEVSFIDLGDVHIAVFPQRAQWRIVNSVGRRLLEECNGGVDRQKINKFLLSRADVSAADVGDFLHDFAKDGLICKSSRSKKKRERNVVDKIFLLTNVGINLTESCNLSCLHCFANSSPYISRSAELPQEAILAIVDNFLQLGSPDFCFSGGEPLLRKGVLKQVIKKLRGVHGIDRIKVITNGTLIEKDDCSFFGQNRVDVQVSLDGATEKIHDTIRGRGVFKKTVRGIKMLVATGVKTSTCTTVMKPNIHYVENIVRFAISLGVREVQTQLMIPVGKAIKNIEAIKICPEEGLSVMAEAKRIAEKRGVWGYEKCSQYSIRDGRRVRPCDVGAYLYVTSNGDMYPCAGMFHPRLKLGNALKDDIVKIWRKNSTLYTLRRLSIDSFSECRSCTYRYFCGGGCRGDVLLVTGDMFAANPFCSSEKNIIKSKIIDEALKLIKTPNALASL